MKTKTKALVLTLCAVLLVVSTVFVTMAYLTSKDEVKNSFTVGKVAITMDEAKVNEYGEPSTGDDRVKANTYKLIPGKMYTKDPTIHVDEDSEKCWLFVKLNNELVSILTETTIESQMTTNGWAIIDPANHIYAYSKAVDPSVADADLDIEVFDTFTVANNATLTDTDGNSLFANKYITVTAYAIQAEGFATAADAWKAAGAEAQGK